ncbi:MAG: caspase family protein [Muribaculaceae bacterium]|nr:caspase family protein [Muribaculaceae bacterium]
MKQKQRLLLPIIAFSGLALIPFIGIKAMPQMDTIELEGSSPVSAEDSIAQLDSITFQLVDRATEAYKHLKFVQYDGIAEEELYPIVKDTYVAVVDALDAPTLQETDKSSLHGIIRDIGNQFMRAAAFYSSKNDNENMTDYASIFADIMLEPEYKMPKSSANMYPALLYIAASGAYNAEKFPEAIKYLNAYIDTGVTDRREQVSMFLAQACLNNGTPEQGIDNLIASVDLYPSNFNLLMLTLQCCIDGGYTDKMQPLLDKALLMRPNDERLLSAQARIYEAESNFAEALPLFQQLYELKPNNLSVNQHLALCYYNLGAEFHNKALMETDEKAAKRYERQANSYFQSAEMYLPTIVSNDPTDTKYLRALAVTYACLGDPEKLEPLNTRLVALGQQPVQMNIMPDAIVFADQTAKGDSNQAVPDFQTFAEKYVEENLAEWTKRKEFEKMEDYQARVSQNNVYQEYQRLCKLAEDSYLARYAGRLRIADLELQPYDIDNETYLITSAMGPMAIKVPLKNKEAEAFKAAWSSIQLRHPKYFIKDNQVAIASVEFVTPAGKSYAFNSEAAANYDFTDVKIDVGSFLAQGNSRRDNNTRTQSSTPSANRVIRAQSDVDVNIPLTSRVADKTVALIIANEDYKNVTNVASALNDGETFAEYCKKTLGVPDNNVILRENVTYAEMIGAIDQLSQYINALGDNVDVILYYAGHGFPDEGSKDAYLLPVDGDGTSTATAYPLKKLYSNLSSMGAENVMVFLDACFSGATREGGMLAEARGVALKPKPVNAEGNMFVLSAASDQETALPYTEKNHGLFTYFLLKKLQDSKGNVTLKDLSSYVEENVKKNSLAVNKKLQTPSTSVSGNLKNTWTSKKLRP